MTDRERALNEIIETNYGESQCHESTMRIAADALRERIERNNGWISVKDKLPECFENVLCFFRDKNYGSKIEVSYFESNSGVCADAFKYGKPTNWMPLPELPKEDKP